MFLFLNVPQLMLFKGRRQCNFDLNNNSNCVLLHNKKMKEQKVEREYDNH